MPRDLHHVDSLGVGMYLQTFILGLTARGLGTCVQMIIAGFPDVVRQALHIPPQYEILHWLRRRGLSRQQPRRPPQVARRHNRVP
ncbi:nitroreductase family protein [Mycolicibacterium aromaticivorans]|uniref:nitroreductase family protein n=1 Tax=Mycolicibacterium aromaticivorans TaxID=318425 RepID=UPI001ED9A6E9|nr:nitroreductase family protein [Mycolicibacterium aromaticivorans]